MATRLPDGVRLLHRVIGHHDTIGRIGWSPDGRLLATPSRDGMVRIWDGGSGSCLRTIGGRDESLLAVAFSADGRTLATGGSAGTNLWNVDSGELLVPLASGVCYAVAFSPRGPILASANDPRAVTLWDPGTGMELRRLTGHNSLVLGVAFSADGGMLATGGEADGTIRVWEMVDGRRLRRRTGVLLDTLVGHAEEVFAVAFHPGGRILASASGDRTIRLWDLATGDTHAILEGHTYGVRNLSFSCDGRVLASNSRDGTIRLWETESGRCRAILPARASSYWTPSVAFHPNQPILAAVGSETDSTATHVESVVQLWEIDVDRLLARPAAPSVSYTTVKIVLVGESGVGKTGLGWRLAHGEFVEHSSTHGQQFWLLDQLGTTRVAGGECDGVECVAILWDLAGQPDYRLIHALYLDDADLALVLFDPTHGEDPLSGVEYWLHQLGRARPIILVAARCDRGAPRLTTDEIEAFCTEYGIAGYVATSALRGDGLDELIKRMRAVIQWDARPTTVTTQTFKRIKDYVLQLKETLEFGKSRGAGESILSLARLRLRLKQQESAAEFTDDEILTTVGHLSNHGYVAYLRTSRGESRILLAPVLLNNLAASMVLEARRNPKGLGSLEEQRVLSGEYHFPELVTLSSEEREVLIDSAVALFLAHSICFRETDPLTKRSYLVFPELINLKKPTVADERPVEDGAAYTVSGAVENVYASLVVLLGYTSTFTRTNQWRNHARYVVGDGLVCGLRKEAEREGELDLVLYFGATVGPPIRTLFQSLFESFLTRRELIVCRYDVVRCAENHQLNRAVVRERLTRGADYAFCPACGQRVVLPPADTPIELTRQQADDRDAQRREAGRRLSFEQVLFRLTTYVTQEEIPAPDCFISYASGDDDHIRWVEHELATDLTKAGIIVVLDRWENARIGASVSRFVDRISSVARVIVVGTPHYRTKYLNGAFVVAAEGDLIGNRMIGSEALKESVLPALLSGTPESSFPPLLEGRVFADFREAERYFGTVFDLIACLYQVSAHEPVRELRRQLDDRF